jgi:hypothetical protein
MWFLGILHVHHVSRDMSILGNPHVMHGRAEIWKLLIFFEKKTGDR